MATRVGINGFGRIGRQVLKAIRERYPDELEVVAINDLFDAQTNAHLFKYDSNYGIYDGVVEVKDGNLVVDGDVIKVMAEKNPYDLPWSDLKVDIVIDGTGIFRDGKGTPDKPGANAHIDGGGAKKVIITAPASNEDLTVVLGVNEGKYDPAKHHIVSNASCTTNCLAPAAKVVHENFTIKRGLMTTIHAYTNDQRILDVAHKDPRRARAAALNIIPTTTGAARALALVIPDLKGKFDGYSLRVPTPTVSVVDFVADVEKPTTAEELNALFKAAAEGELKGILDFSMEPLVSVDLKGNSFSSIIDGQMTTVLDDTFVKVVAWYDNEWGYSCRTADLAAYMAKSL
ncbi:MAG TPA: type I glyceraldehyde-3-phosphate dehydrogenase [Brevefilum fermentans]|jgi:glyceraldehyde 3-phosphate dehydrogenase|nr:type I glyceraldehyde-3-phosphate dehydrogenase [Brevefilum fermentans]HQA28297.1 type I glyceraldehyde-3-phosphate dehydrogenase [Brevefilum fermentans]